MVGFLSALSFLSAFSFFRWALLYSRHQVNQDSCIYINVFCSHYVSSVLVKQKKKKMKWKKRINTF